MSKYTAIIKLKELLEQEGIDFVYTDRSFVGFQHHQIRYPEFGDLVCSVIQGDGSYGRHNDTLEIMGLLTAEELESDTVAGGLSIEDVFERIKDHWGGVKDE